MSDSDSTVISSLPVSPQVAQLYKTVMDLFSISHVSGVFACDTTDNSVVFIKDSVSINHTLWFYRFAVSKLPLVEIIDQGRTLVRRVGEEVLSEDRIVMELQVLVSTIIDRRNQNCILETGLPYEVAMGIVPPPASAKKRKSHIAK